MTSTFPTKDDITSKSPHFFKINLNDQNDKLAIPRKFEKRYGSVLPSMAVLEVPTGAVWQVELSKSDDDGGIWFNRGWKEFADFYSLRKGHFLVFRYENKKGRFHVLVFDMSATEIDYPLTKVIRDEDLKSGEDDVPIESPEDTPPCKKRRRGRPRKILLKTDSNIHHVNTEEPGENDVPIEIPEDTPPCKKRSRGRPPKILLKTDSDIHHVNAEELGGDDVPIEIQGDTPPCKKKSRGRPWKMLNTDTIDEGQKEINKQGFRDSMHSTGDTEETGADDDVSIEILEDIPPCNKKSRRKSPIICSRPRKMLSSNTIDESHREITNQGSRDIYNGCECPEQAEILSFQNLKTKALEIANACKSQNPFFVVIIQKFHLRYKSHLCIPANFAREHLKVTPTIETKLLLSEGERTWSAKYSQTVYNRKTRAKFLYGWPEFALDNSLEVGDVCVFELIKEMLSISFKVAIHRLAQAANCLHLSQDNKSIGHVDCKGSKSDLLESEKACMSNCDYHEPGRVRLNDGNNDQKFVALKVESVERGINNELMDNEEVAAAGAEVIDETQREITKQGSRDIYNGCECPEQAEILSFQNLTTKDMTKALEIANACKSQNPFFVVVVQKFHLRYKSRLCIPVDFTRKHLKLARSIETTLFLSEGEGTWSAKYYHTAYNKQTRSEFLHGWPEFAMDNGLEAGDVCVFELIKETLAISFKVAIHRLAQAANCLRPSQADKKSRGHVDCKGSKSDLLGSEKACMSNVDYHEPGRVRLNDGNKDKKFVATKVDSVERGINNPLMDNKSVAAAGAEVTHEASNPKNPYFKRVLSPSNFNANLHVPIDFIDKHLEPNVEQVILQVANADGQQWAVNLKRYPQFCQSKLTGGFKTFSEENSLKVGDVCVFELIVPWNATFKVSIIKQGQSQSNAISLEEN